MDDATKHQRTSKNVNPFSLYRKLWGAATKKSDGKGFKDGRKCPFTREEIESALRGQGIRNEDMQAAIDHCVKVGLLEQKEDAFHTTESGLADYHCQLWRI